MIYIIRRALRNKALLLNLLTATIALAIIATGQALSGNWQAVFAIGCTWVPGSSPGRPTRAKRE